MSDSMQQLDTVDRYLRDQLAEQERSEFEIQLLEDPELLEEVQRRDAMIKEIKAAKSALTQSIVGSSNTDNVIQLNFGDWIQQPLSIAASVVVAIGALIIVQGQANDTATEFLASDFAAIGSSITLETLRGAEDRLSASGTAPVLISIDTGPSAIGSFTVSLVDDSSGNTVFTRTGVELDAQGWLRVLLSTNLVGDYTVRVNGDSTELSYPVRFVN